MVSAVPQSESALSTHIFPPSWASLRSLCTSLPSHHRAPSRIPCVIQLLPTSFYFTCGFVYTQLYSLRWGWFWRKSTSGSMSDKAGYSWMSQKAFISTSVGIFWGSWRLGLYDQSRCTLVVETWSLESLLNITRVQQIFFSRLRRH